MNSHKHMNSQTNIMERNDGSSQQNTTQTTQTTARFSTDHDGNPRNVTTVQHSA